MRRIGYLWLSLNLVLSSCSYTNRGLAKSVVSPSEQGLATEITEAITDKSFEKLRPFASSYLTESSFVASLSQMTWFVPAKPTSIEPFFVEMGNKDGQALKYIRFELIFPTGQKSILNLYIGKDNGTEQIFGLNFQDAAAIQKKNEFTLQNRSVIDFVFLFLSVGVVIVILAMALVCVILRPKRWILWLIFILQGFSIFDLNWASDKVSFEPFRILMLGGSVSKGGLEYSPWLVDFSIPIGAILFFLKFRSQIHALLIRTRKEKLKNVVATGIWIYGGSKPSEIEVFRTPAIYSSGRYDEDDQLIKTSPIPQTVGGFIYKTSCGGEAHTLEEIMKWADAQPWGPVKWNK
jgi:hypothetical protein